MKPAIHYFVSYARDDGITVQRFMKKLRTVLKNSPYYQFIEWTDDLIPLGSLWEDEISNALDSCDLGLALLSPAFFGSDYITQKELPILLKKPIAPVGLKPLANSADLRGVQRYQIFRDSENRYFSKTSGNTADEWMNQLTDKLHDKLRRAG